MRWALIWVLWVGCGGAPDDAMLAAQGDRGKADGTGSTQVLFVNFDGATLTHKPQCSDARQNCSYLVSGTTQTFAPFDPSPYGEDPDNIKKTIVDWVSRFYLPFQVQIVTERPVSGIYSMIVVGGHSAQSVNPDAFGLAPLDCNNKNRGDIGFVFAADARTPAQEVNLPESQKKVDPLAFLAHTIAHEAGHSFGLDHIVGPSAEGDGETDLLCDDPSCVYGKHNWAFRDAWMSSPANRCGDQLQNDHARLAANLGLSGN